MTKPAIKLSFQDRADQSQQTNHRPDVCHLIFYSLVSDVVMSMNYLGILKAFEPPGY